VVITTCFASCSTSKNAAENKTSNQISFADNMVVAHRGAWKKNNLPENSVASLKHTIELKCKASEFDIRMTKDDSLIINHDASYNKLVIEKTSYADLIRFRLLSNGTNEIFNIKYNGKWVTASLESGSVATYVW
jgi:glycerophosphoryl diester phosphodiesterase